MPTFRENALSPTLAYKIRAEIFSNLHTLLELIYRSTMASHIIKSAIWEKMYNFKQ
jgi:hypothetical protein